MPGSSRAQHPNIGILLRDLALEVVRRVAAGLAEGGFGEFQFFFLGRLLGLSNLNMPGLQTTISGEDLSSSAPS